MNVIYALLFVVFAPLVLVGIGLFFKENMGLRDFEDGTIVTQYQLPGWLRWLQNPEDGLTGDRRGWYWNVYMKGKPDWYKMLIWSGWRNPWNYFKRVFMAVDIRDHTMVLRKGQTLVRDDIGSEGFQWVIAEHNTKRHFFKPFSIFWVIPHKGKAGRCWGCRIGWKIKMKHNTPEIEEFELDYFKAPTFRLYLYKAYS